MKITKKQLKQIIKEELTEVNAAQEMRDRIAAHQGVDPTRAKTGQEVADELEVGTKGLREPWDGIEANAEMIGDNALKIEYLARALGVEIPVDPKLEEGMDAASIERSRKKCVADGGKWMSNPRGPGGHCRKG
tara:strand:+ start:924 stop:1322 length:399 start_codon:yes stop_codon:yes gene_type:complete